MVSTRERHATSGLSWALDFGRSLTGMDGVLRMGVLFYFETADRRRGRERFGTKFERNTISKYN